MALSKLPKEYRKYAVPGGYEKCKNGYGRRCLRQFGFGPETKAPEVVEAPKVEAPKVVEAPKKKVAKKTTSKKKTTKKGDWPNLKLE